MKFLRNNSSLCIIGSILYSTQHAEPDLDCYNKADRRIHSRVTRRITSKLQKPYKMFSAVQELPRSATLAANFNFKIRENQDLMICAECIREAKQKSTKQKRVIEKKRCFSQDFILRIKRILIEFFATLLL